MNNSTWLHWLLKSLQLFNSYSLVCNGFLLSKFLVRDRCLLNDQLVDMGDDSKTTFLPLNEAHRPSLSLSGTMSSLVTSRNNTKPVNRQDTTVFMFICWQYVNSFVFKTHHYIHHNHSVTDYNFIVSMSLCWVRCTSYWNILWWIILYVKIKC